MSQGNQLRVKYDQQFQFHKEMDFARNNYEHVLEKINNFKGPQPDFLKQSFLEKFTTHDDRTFYFYYAALQVRGKNQASKVIQYLFKVFPRIPEMNYTFIFFNNSAAANAYDLFKNAFLLLTLEQLERLKNFVIVRPSFYHKAMDYFCFGTLHKYFYSRQLSFDNCEQLCAKYNIPISDFVDFVPKYIARQQFPKQIKNIPLADHRINFTGQNLTKQQKQQKVEFEESIVALINKQVYTIENYVHIMIVQATGSIGIPLILELLIYYFKTNPGGLHEQGLFRKSVSIDQENEMFAEISKSGNYDCIQKISNPFLVANLIKRFFANLKVPVIPFHIFEQLMHDQGVAGKVAYVKGLIQQLPQVNLLSLMYVLEFLKVEVAGRQADNKMSLHNLAVCFTPCLMRSEKPSMSDLIYVSKGVFVVNLLFANFDEIFGDKTTRAKLLHKHYLNRKKTLQETIIFELDDEEEQNLKSSSAIYEHEDKEGKCYKDIKQFITDKVMKDKSGQSTTKAQTNKKQLQQQDIHEKDQINQEHKQAQLNINHTSMNNSHMMYSFRLSNDNDYQVVQTIDIPNEEHVLPTKTITYLQSPGQKNPLVPLSHIPHPIIPIQNKHVSSLMASKPQSKCSSDEMGSINSDQLLQTSEAIKCLAELSQQSALKQKSQQIDSIKRDK